jgi:hypothetical protein
MIGEKPVHRSTAPRTGQAHHRPHGHAQPQPQRDENRQRDQCRKGTTARPRHRMRRPAPPRNRHGRISCRNNRIRRTRYPGRPRARPADGPARAPPPSQATRHCVTISVSGGRWAWGRPWVVCPARYDKSRPTGQDRAATRPRSPSSFPKYAKPGRRPALSRRRGKGNAARGSAIRRAAASGPADARPGYACGNAALPAPRVHPRSTASGIPCRPRPARSRPRR